MTILEAMVLSKLMIAERRTRSCRIQLTTRLHSNASTPQDPA